MEGIKQMYRERVGKGNKFSPTIEQKGATPIFLNSEWEHRVFCEECGEETEVTIIE